MDRTVVLVADLKLLFSFWVDFWYGAQDVHATTAILGSFTVVRHL